MTQDRGNFSFDARNGGLKGDRPPSDMFTPQVSTEWHVDPLQIFCAHCEINVQHL